MSKLSITSTLPFPNSSVKIPQLGFGVYQSHPNQCITSCLTALFTGYRHIDTAQYYQNEAEVGLALQQSSIPRSEIFVTTKILYGGGSAEKTYDSLLESVRRIDKGSDGGDDGYVDLFLIHAASGGTKGRRELWEALEKLYEQGRTRSIGVSNWGIGHIEEMRGYAKVWPPHVNQIELHPWCQQRDLVAYLQANAITIQAYSPLVRNQKAHDPTLLNIRQAHQKTTAQILIRYALQKNWVPLPKSDNPARIRENTDVFDFELSVDEMKMLDALDQGMRGAIVHFVPNTL